MAKAHDGPVPLALLGMPADVHPERKGGKQEQPSEMF
jgi:hypothetical protein